MSGTWASAFRSSLRLRKKRPRLFGELVRLPLQRIFRLGIGKSNGPGICPCNLRRAGIRSRVVCGLLLPRPREDRLRKEDRSSHLGSAISCTGHRKSGTVRTGTSREKGKEAGFDRPFSHQASRWNMCALCDTPLRKSFVDESKLDAVNLQPEVLVQTQDFVRRSVS